MGKKLKEKMRFAVIGAGFAGLATTWYLYHYTHGSAAVDLFDPFPIGSGASGLSSGLLHGFAGKRANKAWRAGRALPATHKLITEASLGVAGSVILSRGILRPAISEQQITDFQACASQNPDETEWWEKKRCEDRVPGLVLPPDGGGLYIKEGLTIDTPTYLEGLWQRCARLGTQLHKTGQIPLKQLEGYDAILVCMGPLSVNFPGMHTLPIQPIKGQILELAWPEGIPPLPFSLISRKYVVMSRDQKSCHVGATFEREFEHPNPEPEAAARDILPNIHEFFPPLKGAKVLGARAAFRAASPNKLPIVGQLRERIFFFTALGSKGLLYHAYVARRVSRAMITGDVRYLPDDLHYHIQEGEPPQQS